MDRDLLVKNAASTVRTIALVSLTKVRNTDTGVASSLVNVGQQVGGSIGLALLGTVAWSAVATSLRGRDLEVAGARPRSMTSFVGRERELDELRSLFRERKATCHPGWHRRYR